MSLFFHQNRRLTTIRYKTPGSSGLSIFLYFFIVFFYKINIICLENVDCQPKMLILIYYNTFNQMKLRTKLDRSYRCSIGKNVANLFFIHITIEMYIYFSKFKLQVIIFQIITMNIIN